MDAVLFGRYFLEFALLYPGAYLCLAPLRDHLKAPKTTCWIAGGALTALCLGCAALCTIFELPSNVFLLPILIVSFRLLRWRTEGVTVGQTAFLFSISAVMLAVCSLMAVVLNARAETGNQQEANLVSTALLALGLSAVLSVLFHFTAVRWSAWLLQEYHGEAFWQSAWPLPTIYAAFLIFCVPLDPSVVLLNRIMIIAVLAVSISLLGIFLLLYEMYRVAQEYTRNTQLDRENQLLGVESRRYMELREYMEQTRRLRHDFRQHLHVIFGLTEAGQLDELKHYLSQYESELSEARPTLCANPASGCAGGPLRPRGPAEGGAHRMEAGAARSAAHAGSRPVHDPGQSAGKCARCQPEADAGPAADPGDGPDAQPGHAGHRGGEPLRRCAEKAERHPALHQA